MQARRAEDQLVGLRLHVVDELLQRLVGCWSLTTSTIGSAMKRAIGMKSSRVNLTGRPIQLVDLGKAGDRHDVHEQRVAVGLGGCGELGADLAGRAGLGLDHHRLLEDRLQHGGERPGDDVGGAARRKRIDEGDGARGIDLLRDSRPAASAAAAAAEPATKLRLSMRSSRGETGIHCATRPRAW